MKNIIIKGVVILIAAMFSQTDTFGQTGRFGNTPEDSIRCLRTLSLYGDRHNQQNFEEALPYWRVLFEEFPIASRNIYIWGTDLFSYLIENAENEEVKKAYLDTAMMMFDQRIEYYEGQTFGDPANVLGRKGLFFFQHNNNLEEAGPGYEALAESIRLSGTASSPAAMVTYMNVTVGKFMAGMVDSEEVIETYTYLMGIIDEAPPSAPMQNAGDMMEQLFANSGAADCDALVELFAGQVDSSPEDADLLNKVNDLLTNANCTDTDLYLTVTINLHDLDPTPRTALNLSAMYRDQDNYEKVVEYINQAIELQDDPNEKANYYFELAIIAHRVENDVRLSRQYALQALRENAGLGRAHLHIGSLYASESDCFEGEEDANFKKRTVYWVAVDRFNEAKRVDSSLTSEANRLIQDYSPYFPDNETIFFQGYQTGEQYTVGCWINETTRIRPRPE